MRVTSLGSGSSGNALLVEAGPQRRTKVLIDAGLSSRILIDRLRQASTHPAQLQGVLITHEHGDHIIGLPVLMKRYAIPVISAPDTHAAIEQSFISGSWLTEWIPTNEDITAEGRKALAINALDIQNGAEITEENESQGNGTQAKIVSYMHRLAMPLPPGSHYMLGDIEVVSFPVSHDAAAPCGYLLSAGGCRVCVAIDSGEVTPVMLEMMHRADLLVIESNHDRERLLRGPYPYALKQRILSPTGHLSNDQAADAVLRTWRADSVRWLWLSHLSRTNNTPRLALNSMLVRLEAARASLDQVHISVLPPGMGSTWDSTQLWESPSLWQWQ